MSCKPRHLDTSHCLRNGGVALHVLAAEPTCVSWTEHELLAGTRVDGCATSKWCVAVCCPCVFSQGGGCATCDTQRRSTLESRVSLRTHVHVCGHVQRPGLCQCTLKKASDNRVELATKLPPIVGNACVARTADLACGYGAGGMWRLLPAVLGLCGAGRIKV